MSFLARGPGNHLFFSSSESRERSGMLAEFSASQFLQELALSLGGDSTLRRKLGEDAYAALRSIAREPHPQYFFEAILDFAQRLEKHEEAPELSTVFYSQILQSLQAFPEFHLPRIAQLAQERLDAIQGRGAVLPRAEFLLRRLAQQASDPAMIAAMAVASGAFSMTRLATLSRLAASPTSRLWAQGAGARLIANTAGFLAEAPAFTAAARGMNALLNRQQDWSATALGREFASGAITLLGLKLAGGAASSLVQRLNYGLTPAQLSSSRTLLSAGISQTATLGSILASHGVEERLGLREHVDGATALTDALGTLLNLHVGGRLMHQALGPRYQELSQSLILRSEWLRVSISESAPTERESHSNLRQAGALAAILRAGLAIIPAESEAAIRAPVSQPSEHNRNLPFALTALATAGLAVARRRSRREITPEIEESLSRLATHAIRSRFQNIGELNARIGRILEALQRPEDTLDLQENQALDRFAELFLQLLNMRLKGLDVARFTETLGTLESGLRRESGSILVERTVQDFCQEFALARKPAASTARAKAAAEPEAEARPEAPSETETTPPAATEATPRLYTLRDYQETLVSALRQDVLNQISPWLGLASPMQTGKSFLAGPIIQMLREGLGPRARFIILSSGRVITDQVVADLLEGFRASEVGRFDGRTKDIRPITVASVYSLARHLEDFNHEGPTVLINDEAFFTQAPIYRQIYQHFGLGEVSGLMLRPKAGNGLVIGLSGTGSGLEGHHISGQLNILDAIENGWIRHMRGERVTMDISYEEKEDAAGERMIWWEANPANAESLAEVYARQLHGHYRKNLIFVPTIEHGELLNTALQGRFGDKHASVAHSQMGDIEFDAAVDAWQREGGALISVKRLSRGFRGTGTDAVFHTYQSNSAELFGQRTGRAWGQSTQGELSDLYVLEATWSHRPGMANLARLLGVVEYPHHAFSTRGLRERRESVRKNQEMGTELVAQIKIGSVRPVFSRIPTLNSWRRSFAEILVREGGANALAERTGLPVESIVGWGLGALPIRLNEVRQLQGVLGGEDAATELWLRSWKQAIDEIDLGLQRTEEPLANDLRAWRNNNQAPAERAASLDEIFARHFPVDPGPTASRKRGSDPTVRYLREMLTEYGISTDLDDGRLAEMIRETALREFPPDESPLGKYFRDRYLSSTPKSAKQMAEETSHKSIHRIQNYIATVLERVAKSILRCHFFEDPRRLPLNLLEMNWTFLDNSKASGDRKTVGDILSLGRSLARAQLKPQQFQFFENHLRSLGLSFHQDSEIVANLQSPSPELRSSAPAELFQEIRDSLRLSPNSLDMLMDHGIYYTWQLVQLPPGTLGRIGFDELRELKVIKALREVGLDLGFPMSSRLDESKRHILDRGILYSNIDENASHPLLKEGIVYYGQLARMNLADLQARGLQMTQIRSITSHLAGLGLRLGMSYEWQEPEISSQALHLSISFSTHLNLGRNQKPLRNQLIALGILTNGELTQKSENDLVALGITPDSILKIQQGLAEMGLRLARHIQEQPSENLAQSTHLDLPVDFSGFKYETQRILREDCRVKTIGDLVKLTERGLRHLMLMPEIRRIAEYLNRHGLHLGQVFHEELAPRTEISETTGVDSSPQGPQPPITGNPVEYLPAEYRDFLSYDLSEISGDGLLPRQPKGIGSLLDLLTMGQERVSQLLSETDLRLFELMMRNYGRGMGIELRLGMSPQEIYDSFRRNLETEIPFDKLQPLSQSRLREASILRLGDLAQKNEADLRELGLPTDQIDLLKVYLYLHRLQLGMSIPPPPPRRPT